LLTEIISEIVIVKKALSISVVIIICMNQNRSMFMPITVAISITKIGRAKQDLKLQTNNYSYHRAMAATRLNDAYQ